MAISNLARVVLWMIGALLSFSAMAISVRELAKVGLNIFEILSYRSGGTLIILLIAMLARPSLLTSIRTHRMKLHLVRNCIHFVGQYGWSVSLTMLPLATVFALEFTTPAWTAVLAPFILKERLTWSRVAVVVLGLIGVLIILRPGLESVSPAALILLGAAICYAFTMVTTKMLTRTDSTVGIIFWMGAIQLPLGLMGSDLSVFLTLDPHHIIPAFAVAVAGTSSHYCLSNAFRAGDATLVVPLDFMRIPLIAVVGWAFYGEALDIFVLIGALVIIAGVLWNLRAERATARAARDLAPP